MPRAAASHAGFLGVFLLAALAGRATTIGESSAALVWPAAGVGVLWCMAHTGRQRWITIALLALATTIANAVTAATWPVICVFVVSNLAHAVFTTWLLANPRIDLPVVRWRAPFATPRHLGRVLFATLLGGALSAVLGALGLWLFDEISTTTTLTWWGRNTVGTVGVVTTGLLVLDALSSRPMPRLFGGRVVEGLLLTAVTAGLVVLDFANPAYQFVFFLPAAAVWAGMRFPTFFVAIHSLVAGSGAIALTLNDHGPFARVQSPELAALGAQLFVAMVVVLGLFLAIAQSANHLLTAELTTAHDEAEHRAFLMRAVLMSMEDPVLVVDHRTRVTMANRAAVRALTDGETELVGADLSALELEHPDGTPLPLEARPSARARRGQTARDEVRFPTIRTRATYTVTATPLGSVDDAGDVVLVLHDVTRDRDQQAALAAFASTVAHDLQNPLAAIQMWTEMLEMEFEDDCPAPVANAMAHINSGTRRMSELISDLLTDARSRTVEVRHEVTDLAEVTRAAAQQVPGASAVVRDMPPVVGDPVLLGQVLVNLIGNAVKYAGGRDPEVVVSGELSAHDEVVVRVADRGPGIPEDQLEAVFESFQRVPGTKQPGTGLGLAICRRIVERHGGRIVARQRTDGPGTIMEFTVPAAPTRA